MRVVWQPRATRDRDSQIAYLADHSLNAALAAGSSIELAVNRLADYPLYGRLGRVPGTRELVVAGTPYVIAYRVEATTILILRLLHGAQRWPRLL